MEHAHKSVTIQGIVKALKAHGWLAKVRGAVSPSTAAILDDPLSAKFQPGTALDEVYEVLAALESPQAIETVLYESTRDSMAGIFGPLAKLFLTTIGATPRTLLSRFDTLLSSGTRGFEVKWEDTGEKSGRLTISTEKPAGVVGDHAWKGVLQFLLEFARSSGTITVQPRTNAGRSAHFDVTWN